MTAAPFTVLDVPRADPDGSRWVAFTYQGFGTVRAFLHSNGLAYFVAADIAKQCGIQPKTYRAARTIPGPAHVLTVQAPRVTGKLHTLEAISEAGIIVLLAARARDEAVIECLRWVTETAVPALRTADRQKAYRRGIEAGVKAAGATA